MSHHLDGILLRELAFRGQFQIHHVLELAQELEKRLGHPREAVSVGYKEVGVPLSASFVDGALHDGIDPRLERTAESAPLMLSKT
jgi:hypothetical protein